MKKTFMQLCLQLISAIFHNVYACHNNKNSKPEKNLQNYLNLILKSFSSYLEVLATSIVMKLR